MSTFKKRRPLGFGVFIVICMDNWTIKTPNPICRLFFKIDLLTEFAALCLTDFIDWRSIHSLVGIFDPACELLPLWTKELYFCTVAPSGPSIFSLTSPPSPPSQTKCTVYTDSVCLGGGGSELCCRPYSAGILHSVSDQIQSLPNCFTTTNKMTSEDDIKGLVSFKVPSSMVSWFMAWPLFENPKEVIHGNPQWTRPLYICENYSVVQTSVCTIYMYVCNNSTKSVFLKTEISAKKWKGKRRMEHRFQN